VSAVCFAFGQTGSGKTHTLLGNKTVRGLYELAASDLFALADGLALDVVASYYEIYCGQLYDLLTKRTRSSTIRYDRRVQRGLKAERGQLNLAHAAKKYMKKKKLKQTNAGAHIVRYRLRSVKSVRKEE